MSNTGPLVRQWTMLRILSARRLGASVAELAAELEVGDKTIRRDLAAFVAAGFPLEETVGERGRKLWKLSDRDAPPLSFALDEALALYLGRRFLEPLAGTFLGEAAQGALQKVRACLGPTALEYLDRMAGNLHQTFVGRGDYSARGDIVDQLMLAIDERKATHIEYQSARATEPVSYEVFPLGMADHRGSWYLVAFSRDHDMIRHFKVDRISAIEVSKFPFQLPEGFDLKQHFAGSFGVFHGSGNIKVRVRFASSVARYVTEGQWHASQKLERQKDGSLLAEFTLGTTVEIKSWIFSFGRHAEVLDPKELREEMAEEVTALAATYDNPKTPPTVVRKTKAKARAR